MRKILFIILMLISTLSVLGQIDMNDSTVQAITYWNKGDKALYSITSVNTKTTTDGDTVSSDTTYYDMELLVKKAKANSYTVQWTYTNFRSNNPDWVSFPLGKMLEGYRLVYEIDELGTFKLLKNTSNLDKRMNKLVKMIVGEIVKGREEDVNEKKLTMLVMSYLKKLNLRELYAEEIMRYHFFYGLKYKLNDVTKGQMETSNPAGGGKPIIKDVEFYLSELDEENKTYTMVAQLFVDNKQLLQLTVDMVNAFTDNIHGDKVVEALNDENINNNQLIVSIISEDGWVISSYYNKTVVVGENKRIDEVMVDLK